MTTANATAPTLSRSELLAAAARAGEAGRWQDAIAPLREASFLDPSDGTCFARLGQACLEASDLAEALAALERAVRLAPDDAMAQFHLGRAKLLAAEPEAAAARFRRCLALDPEDPFGARAALDAAARPVDRLPAPFVRALFDRYAENYDGEMTGVLRYAGPRALRALWDRLADDARALDILDLGCGTGLAGVAFRDLARRLEGVDLAPRAVAKAEERGIYHRLAVGDAIDALAAAQDAWDLIVAADVFPYVGDLGPAFAAAARALRPGGRMLATCERSDESDGWRLGPTRRFAHAIRYLRRTADDASLTVEALEETSVRTDRRRPVPGVVFALRRPAEGGDGPAWTQPGGPLR